MKFTDKKYIAIRDYNDVDIYNLNFQIYTLGFPSSYDDISVDLTIDQKDNSLEIIFDNQTEEIMFADIEEQNDLLLEIKKNLIKFPYPGNEYELIFEEKL